MVVDESPDETVSMRIEDWFVKSDVFKKGHWRHLDAAS